ncbi:AI-2E family transporter [Demetria terragena]|uniref:AI-2E family transporter n=1 Tax=Demetria terragena TaxID=63959 RepID=UPI0003647AD1|nr:AI-2E family transporter [Demetria terragena]
MADERDAPTPKDPEGAVDVPDAKQTQDQGQPDPAAGRLAGPDPDLVAGATGTRPNRAAVIGEGVRWTSIWALRIAIILVTLWIVKQLLGPLWIAILPILLGLVLATVLWPPTRWLRSKGLGPAPAAAISVISGLVIFLGAMTAIGSSVASQAPDLAKQASAGVAEVQDWAQGAPLNLKEDDISQGFKALTDKISESAAQIAGGVVGGITSTLQVFVTLLLALLLAFFFIKDGPRFAPWVRRAAGDQVGGHLTEVFARMWGTLGGYIRGQALVSAIDAVFIGAGLAILGVPLWLPLATVTFFAGFIPIVGATVAGALAVLVALVSTSFTKALIVLAIVIIVQQIEGNLLQPLIQSRSMNLHAGLVILSVTVGSHMYGIIGAFLAVPATALLLVFLRYLQEQIDLRSGTFGPGELEFVTEEGRLAAELTVAQHTPKS